MFYSQRDPKWKNVRLGTCRDTIGQSGCFMTSLANLAWKVPVDINKLFTEKGVYINGCLIDSGKASSLLNLEYNGKTTRKPDYVCIAETNYYAKQGVSQHFFLWNPDGRIADPLDLSPDWQQNTKKYPIVSYRLFRFRGNVASNSGSVATSATVDTSNASVSTANTSTVSDSSASTTTANTASSSANTSSTNANTTQPVNNTTNSNSVASSAGTASTHDTNMATGRGLFAELLESIRKFF